jgi:mRNA-degrading endonuclease toxin of MazEF toxin-antitoxin module
VVAIGNRPPLPPGPQRGEIYQVAFRDIGGNVLSGPHPAVVVQTPRMAGSSTTLVAPLTSRARSADLAPPYLVRALARETGLRLDGWVKVDQIFTFPAAELTAPIGRLPPARIEELDRALRFVLAL